MKTSLIRKLKSRRTFQFQFHEASSHKVPLRQHNIMDRQSTIRNPNHGPYASPRLSPGAPRTPRTHTIRSFGLLVKEYAAQLETLKQKLPHRICTTLCTQLRIVDAVQIAHALPVKICPCVNLSSVIVFISRQLFGTVVNVGHECPRATTPEL